MTERDFDDYVRDMLDAVDKAARFVAGLDYAGFASDDKTVFAVIRALEVIGEACRHLPEGVRAQHPSVPWRSIAGTRDRLIHRYFGVDLEVVWRTVQEDLPRLRPVLEQILAEYPSPRDET
jgi:uncharacterized protein with HEPN domain